MMKNFFPVSVIDISYNSGPTSYCWSDETGISVSNWGKYSQNSRNTRLGFSRSWKRQMEGSDWIMYGMWEEE